jgi:hypothetical protein
MEKAEIEKYMSNQGSASNSLGALIREEMNRRSGEASNKKGEQ